MQERLGVSGARPPEGAHTAAGGEGIPVSAARPPEGAPVGAADGSAPGALRQALARSQRRRQWRAFSLTLPLLLFLLLTLLLPIAALLLRPVENPEVARALPGTIPAPEGRGGPAGPPPAAYAALVRDLADLPDGADAGALARRLNSEVRG